MANGNDPINMMAQEFSQQPVSDLDRLRALQKQMIDLQNQQLQAQQNYSSLNTGVPSMAFRREGQTFGEAFKDPSAAQRNAIIQFGLGLAGSDSTKNLSQRLAQALGPGIQTLQATRQAEQTKDLNESKAELARLQLQQQQLKSQFDLQKIIAEESRLRGVAPDLDRESTKAIIADIEGLRKNVLDTENMLVSAQRAENALPNATVGLGANAILGVKKVATLFGIPGFKDDISSGEALKQVLGENVLEVMKSGALGAGTGLSDNDRKFAADINAGNITLSEENIKYAIDAKRRAANFFRQRYNDAIDNYGAAFKEAGRTPAYFRARQKEDRYDLVEFTPISKEGRLLFGTEPGTLMRLQKEIPNTIISPGLMPAVTPENVTQMSTNDLFKVLMGG